MKTLDNRIADVERRLEQVRREVARKPAREAAQPSARRGWFLGITREDFTQGVDTLFSVDVWIWSETLQKWRKVPGMVIQARDWFLNADETVEKDTKVKVEWYETTWVVTAMYCSPTDIDEYGNKRAPLGDDYGGGTKYDHLGDFGLASYSVSYDAGGGFSSGGGYFNWD